MHRYSSITKKAVVQTCRMFICIILISGHQLVQAQDLDEVKITTEQLSEHVYVLYGSGGNIGIVVSDDGVYMIDDQYAELTDKIVAAIAKITDQPVKYLINTHWHPDHTGGNANMAQKGAVIVAHDNVYERLSTEQDRGEGRIQQPSPEAALPEITYSDQLTMHLDTHTEIMLIHEHNAHTDTDGFVYFPSENVLHTGDVFVSGQYPFIDINSGGSVDGLIEALNAAIFLVNDQTKIIPGHGKVSDRDELVSFRDMMETIRQRVQSAMQKGKSLEEIRDMNLTKEWDKERDGGFISASKLIGHIYHSLED